MNEANKAVCNSKSRFENWIYISFDVINYLCLLLTICCTNMKKLETHKYETNHTYKLLNMCYINYLPSLYKYLLL